MVQWNWKSSPAVTREITATRNRGPGDESILLYVDYGGQVGKSGISGISGRVPHSPLGLSTWEKTLQL